MNAVTFALLVTPAGVIIAAAIITSLVQLVKNSFNISGAYIAFGFSLALYIAAAVALLPLNADGFLGVFLAWLSCATSAVGIHSTIGHVAEDMQGNG